MNQKGSQTNLLRITNRTHLLFTTFLLLLVGAFLYGMMRSTVEEEIVEKLIVNKERIAHQLANDHSVPNLPPVIEVEELDLSGNKDRAEESIAVNKTVLYDSLEKDQELFVEVSAVEAINGHWFRITLRQVILESHDYYSSIGLILIMAGAFMLLGLFLINRYLLHKLWSPFYQHLEVLQKFSLQEPSPPHLQASNITEFQELGVAIEKLLARVHSDYHSLKEFTENASHELQTPLAIIQSKLEQAMQSPNIDDETSALVNTAYSSTRRLAKLNQALLLLAKIENRQFVNTERIHLAETIERSIEIFQDFYVGNELTVERSLDRNMTVSANSWLVDTLLSNLIENAVKHNIQGGQISIELHNNTLNISNTGPALSLQTEQLFQRFQKADPSSTSVGLGLAIVKEICTTYNWSITFSSVGEQHTITVQFYSMFATDSQQN